MTSCACWGPWWPRPTGCLVVTGYRACSALLRDHRLRKAPERALAAAGYPDWRDRPSLRLLYTSIMMLDPPAHTRLRRLVSAIFTARRVQGLRPAVEQIVAQACEQVAGDNDFVACFAFALPVTVIGELLGIPAADRPMFRDWAAVLKIKELGPPAVDRADAAAIGSYLAGLAAHRRVHPAGDLISALAAAQAGDQLTQDELVTMAALLLAAGFGTTTGLLANGLVALLAHPGQARRLRTEAGLAASAVEELLRYDSPVQLVARTAPAGVDVAGLTTSEGQRVVACWGPRTETAGKTAPARLPDTPAGGSSAPQWRSVSRGDVADRRDLDPAPPARRAATAAAEPPEPELGGPGTARDPARPDTESAAPQAEAAGHSGHDPALAPRRCPPPLGR